MILINDIFKLFNKKTKCCFLKSFTHNVYDHRLGLFKNKVLSNKNRLINQKVFYVLIIEKTSKLLI